MLVVSDTSVLINLAVIGEVRILQRLFFVVVAPSAVRAEFGQIAVREARFRGACWPDWVEVRQPASISADLLTGPHSLHTGEREAIALALELHADLLLIDEDAGRAAAKAHGLAITGIAGILLRAKASGLIPSVASILDRIVNECGFWIGSAFRESVLRLAGETP
jgi:predicted nucleic acid-binding protein